IFFFFTLPAPPQLSPLSLHDALPISADLITVLAPLPVLVPMLAAALCLIFGRSPRVQGTVMIVALAAIVVIAGMLLFLADRDGRSEEHTSELQSRENLVCRLLLEKKK